VNDAKRGIYPSRFFRSTLIYAVGDLLTKGARIVLIPYYIHSLTKDEIGLWAVLQVVVLATWTLLAFGFGAAIQRFYNDYEDRGDQFVSSLWWSRMMLSLLPAIALGALGYFYATRWSEATMTVPLILMAVAAGYFRASLNLTEQWFIIQEKPAAYRTFTFLQFLTTMLLNFLFISGFGWGVTGAIGAELVSCMVWCGVSAGLLARAARPQRNLIRWSELFIYCLPAMPHAFFMWGMSGVDRVILERQVNIGQIGEYHIGYLLASVVSIVALAMRSAWLPSFFRDSNTDSQRAQFGKTATLFFHLIIFCTLGGFLFADEIVALFAAFSTKKFGLAADVLRIVVIGNAGLAIFIGLNQPLFYERRIGLLATISGVGLAVNVAMNLMLIPSYGVFGAAWATLVTYLVIGVAILVTVSKLYGIRWELSKLFLFLAVAGAAGMLATVLPTEPLWFGWAAKSVLLVGFLMATLFKIESSKSGWRLSLRVDGFRPQKV
jgi:O-antigen/teichoic acid export membrane protein